MREPPRRLADRQPRTQPRGPDGSTTATIAATASAGSYQPRYPCTRRPGESFRTAARARRERRSPQEEPHRHAESVALRGEPRTRTTSSPTRRLPPRTSASSTGRSRCSSRTCATPTATRSRSSSTAARGRRRTTSSTSRISASCSARTACRRSTSSTGASATRAAAGPARSRTSCSRSSGRRRSHGGSCSSATRPADTSRCSRRSARGVPVVALAAVCDPPTWENDAVAAFFGGERAAPEASPLAQAPLGVRTIVIHGTADDVVPFEQSQRYARRGRRRGDAAPARRRRPLRADRPAVPEVRVTLAAVRRSSVSATSREAARGSRPSAPGGRTGHANHGGVCAASARPPSRPGNAPLDRMAGRLARRRFRSSRRSRSRGSARG